MSDEQPSPSPTEEPVPSSGAPEPAPVAAPSEAELLKDRLLRLQADFDNFRKRAQREKAEWAVLASESLIRELLPVVDHFEIGLRTARDTGGSEPVLKGFQMVQDQLLSVLRKAGLTPVDAPTGVFDPHQHEAVAQIPSPDHAADYIVSQSRRGWKLGEKLIRPVQVVISSGPPADSAATGAG